MTDSTRVLAVLDINFKRRDTEGQQLPGVYSLPGGELLLARVNDQPAWCAGLRLLSRRGACEIKRLVVNLAFRSHSYWLSDIAHARRYARVRLDTHVVTMETAVALYRQYGFLDVPGEPMPEVEGLLNIELVIAA